MTSSFSLTGKICVVTGAASGIGAATARAFLAADAQAVYVADLDVEAARATAHAFTKEGLRNAQAAQLDVTSAADCERLRALLAADQGRLDVLVNNAGIGFVGSIEETQAKDLDQLYEVNVKGIFLVTKTLLPLLVDHAATAEPGAATILNVASIAGLVGLKRRFAYSLTKGAVIALTRQLAVDYVARGVRVNAVCPGTVDTPFVDAYLKRFHAGEEDKTRRELDARQPIGRMGRADEIASLLVYLASDAATFATGAAWPLDGGLTMV
jgi:NAD(P)-dependent dehydrogenase (short-subunit alcohol dehydrogenase family)